MCPQMGVVTDADLAAAVAAEALLRAAADVAEAAARLAADLAHAALTITHGAVTDIADQTDIATHAALTVVHGTVDDIADQTDIAAHAADIDSHHDFRGRLLRVGSYITPSGLRCTASSTTIANNNMYTTLWVVKRDLTIDRLAVDVHTGEVNADARLGIYNIGVNMYPGTLLYDAGAVDLDAVSVKALVIDPVLTIPAGYYWLAVLLNSPGNAGKLWYFSVGSLMLDVLNTNFSEHHTGWGVIQAYGALPDPFPAGGVFNNVRAFAVLPRIASLA